VDVLYMVAVTSKGVPAPRSWADLTGPAYAGGVALPDPGLAASALGTLGYFARTPGYGMAFYRDLKENGATQVSTPDDVVTAVAQGVSVAGLTIATSAYAAQNAGSPIRVTWPQPGAVAIASPIALSRTSTHSDLAKSFISFVASTAGQRVIAAAGAYPTLPGVGGPTVPASASVVSPDWSAIAPHTDDLLAAYRDIFGG
jgi:iron(III) transport system substrate-binding protein